MCCKNRILKKDKYNNNRDQGLQNRESCSDSPVVKQKREGAIVIHVVLNMGNQRFKAH